jgi:two-component system, chemotaxis family, response regulator Rcp1
MSVDVLLIEDNVGEVVLIHDAVKRLPVPVNLHLALDGHQALLVLSNPHFQPDLIVLDLNIPKIPGTELLDLWKGYRTPVVVLSSSSNPAEREFCLASGAREFVAKPVELEEFQETVGRIIEQWGSRAVGRSVVASSAHRSGTGYCGCRSSQLHLRERR